MLSVPRVTAWCRVLLSEKVRVSGLSKGKGLEQRVMELTD